ncbi:MAG: hypothetical protein GTO18_21825 [Anaerolineales bacterium]|nr:hypothetical protein [Anaerolineales bacterium]
MTILIELGLVVLCYLLITRFLAKGQVLSPRHELALATGALCFFILMAPFHVTDQARPDDPTGMGWVGLAAAILLIWLNIRVRRSETDISDDVKTEYLNSRSD